MLWLRENEYDKKKYIMAKSLIWYVIKVEYAIIKYIMIRNSAIKRSKRDRDIYTSM